MSAPNPAMTPHIESGKGYDRHGEIRDRQGGRMQLQMGAEEAAVAVKFRGKREDKVNLFQNCPG